MRKTTENAATISTSFNNNNLVDAQGGTLSFTGTVVEAALGDFQVNGGMFQFPTTRIADNDLGDLQVAPNPTVPATLTIGETIDLSWVVENQGNDITSTTAWVDAIFLSEDDQLDFNDILVGIRRVESGQIPLNIGSSYTANLSVTVPDNTTNSQFILFATDWLSGELEENENNNVLAQSVQVTAPPEEISVSSLEITDIEPSSVSLGEFSSNTTTDTEQVNNETTVNILDETEPPLILETELESENNENQEIFSSSVNQEPVLEATVDNSEQPNTNTSEGTELLPLTTLETDSSLLAFATLENETEAVSLPIVRQSFTYDSVFNQLTSITDELGRQTLFDIDSNNGNILSTTQVVGEVGGDDDIVTQFTYTANGLVDLQTDANGRVTDFDYDEFGRVVTITTAKGTADEGIQRFEYNAAGNVSASIDENGNRTEYLYDLMNRLVRITEADPDGTGPLTSPVTTLEYDAAGNLISTTDPLDNVTENEYDELNRLSQTTDALGNETQFDYDGNSNLTSIIDPLDNETENRYDARDRLIETIDPDGGSTKFGYDLDDNLISVIDPVGNETTFIYDARNRLVEEIDPLGNSIFYEYDVVDNLVAQTDRNNRRSEFNYDELDRLINETWVGTNQVVNYNYDKVSNLLSVQDNFSSLAFTYDNRDRTLSVDNASTPNAPNVILDYTYDAVGNIVSLTDTINGVVGGTNTYSYDGLNRVTEITQSGNGVSDKNVDFGYNALSQFTSINRYSNTEGTQLVTDTNYIYDELNRLTNLTHNNGATDVAFYNFTYDSDSRITQIADIDGVTDYTYDDRDQLIGADHSDGNNPDETYNYDANGNRISSSIHNDGYVTGDGNRLLSDGTFNYKYDNEGNLINQTNIATGEIKELEWDYRNRLVAVINKDADDNETQRVEFTYDAFDRRIAKAVDTNPQDANDAVVTHFVYDDGNDVLLDFVDEDGVAGANEPVLAQRYLHGPAIDQVLAQDDGNGNVIWHLTDHLRTVRDLVDNSSAVVNHLTYDSFGNVITETDSTVDSRYLYTGREFDEEIGLYYYRARYYNATTGRFLSEDPIRFSAGDVNLYRYVNNKPTLTTDPTGLIDPKDKEQIKKIAEETNVGVDELSKEMHTDKNKVGRGGKDNLDEKTIRETAEELKEIGQDQKIQNQKKRRNARRAKNRLKGLSRALGPLGCILDIINILDTLEEIEKAKKENKPLCIDAFGGISACPTTPTGQLDLDRNGLPDDFT